jgi:hypothetical protein
MHRPNLLLKPTRILLALSLGLALMLLPSCDSAGPSATPSPRFSMDVGAPVQAALDGEATLGTDLTFGEQSVFTLPVGPMGQTATIIQLAAEKDNGVTHDLSFVRLADDGLEPGQYSLGVTCEGDCGPQFFPPEEIFTADYGRQTTDSLHTYPIKEGTVTIETATDDEVSGTFKLTSTREVSIARADLEAFLDSLRTNPPTEPGERPTLPPRNIQSFETPMTIEGQFTATPGDLLETVTHLGGFNVGTLSGRSPAGRTQQ